MKRRTLLQTLPVAALFPAAGWAAGRQMNSRSGDTAIDQPLGEKPSGADDLTTVYELRVYHCAPGKLGDLLARFRDHTVALFAQHGLQSVAYWVPADEPLKSNTLIYILRHPSRDAAAANWKSFQGDPAWVSVKEKSEANGKLVESIDSTFMTLADFSPKLS
jgi:NIPSNAP